KKASSKSAILRHPLSPHDEPVAIRSALPAARGILDLGRSRCCSRIAGTIPPSSWELFGDQDDLADVAPLGDEAVRVRRPVEREDLCDDWLQLSLLEPRYQRFDHPVEASLGVPPREHVEAKDALVLVHHPQPLPPWHRRE